MSTLSAGFQLKITPYDGGVYDLTIGGTTTSAISNGKCIGPFASDVDYSVAKTGTVEVSSVSSDGLKYYEAGELPSPTAFGYGHQVMLTGSFSADTTEILLSVGVVAGAKSWVGDVVSANDAPVDPASLGIPDGVTWVKLS